MVSANGHMAFHADGLSAMARATLCEGFGEPTSGKASRGQKRLVPAPPPSPALHPALVTLPPPPAAPESFQPRMGEEHQLYKRSKNQCKYLMDLDPRVMQSGPWKLGGLSTFTDECVVELFLPC